MNRSREVAAEISRPFVPFSCGGQLDGPPSVAGGTKFPERLLTGQDLLLFYDISMR